MSLSDQQFEFLKDVVVLILFAIRKGFKVTGGELWRPKEMQKIYLDKGKSKVKYSQHQKRLAIDLNFFLNGKLTYKKKTLSEIGKFWESLNSKNRWGGNFKGFVDTTHWERLG